MSRKVGVAQPKSHGGCITCKIRKVKCDETRPICRRCRSTGRKCDGYQPIQSLQLSILNNPQELRSYHYFWKQVLPLLPGHYDHLFWGTWVRRACFNEPAIQHAMVAVGALHESIASLFVGDSGFAARHRFFSIQQYNKAIKHLTDNATHSPPTEFVLTTCVMFIMFENMCGRNSEALKHLKSGIAMLQLWKPTTTSEMVLKEEYLTPIYTRGYVREPSADMLTAFEDLQTARKHLQMRLDRIYSSVDSSAVSGDKLAVDAKVLSAMNLLEEWFVKFASLRDPKDIEQQRATILLRLQFETALILLVGVLSDDECEFDKHINSFQVIVSQCEQLVALEGVLMGNDSAKSKAFTYAFDLSFLPALNITALKCRDPQLRRKAIALLNNGNRYEGLWNGKTVARIAQETMKVEEAGLLNVVSCTDIPRRNRMRLAALSYDPGCDRSFSRDGRLSPSATPHYTLEWSRDILDGQLPESVRGYLQVSPQEKSCSWGPGSSPWHMVFQYDTEWAQWKMSFLQQDTTSRQVGSKGESSTQSGQQVNLFWDHWRIRKIPLQGKRTAVDDILEKAASSGRDYGNLQTPDGGEIIRHMC